MQGSDIAVRCDNECGTLGFMTHVLVIVNVLTVVSEEDRLREVELYIAHFKWGTTAVSGE